MSSRYRRVRRYISSITATVVLCFSAASAVLVWQEVNIRDKKYRNASFHLPTISFASSMKHELYRLQLLDSPRRTDSIRPPARQKRLFALRTALESIVARQDEHGGKRYAATVDKITREYDALARLIDMASPSPDSTETRFQRATQALTLSVAQLERQHSIDYAEVERRIAKETSRRNLIVLPTTTVILLFGMIALIFLTRETRAALITLETADEELKRLNENLEQRVEARTAELQSTRKELLRKERLAALGQLTATVSHELRNPLGAMRTSIAAIKRLVRDDQALLHRSIEIADRSVSRCDNIINDLLDYSRARRLEPEVTAVDDWLGQLLREYRIPPSVTLSPSLGCEATVAIDRERLRRAIVNLLDNACQAMLGEGGAAEPENERILAVATARTDRGVEISVADNGPGMAPEEFEKIFEPMYSTKAFGVGLGLQIVKQILSQHGGDVEVDRRAGPGARFVVWLPLVMSKQVGVG